MSNLLTSEGTLRIKGNELLIWIIVLSKLKAD